MTPASMQPLTVRLSLDTMRHEVVHAFTGYESEIKDRIDKAMQDAINNFDFNKEVGLLAGRLIQQGVAREVEQAVMKLLWNEPLRQVIADAIQEGLHEVTARGRGNV